MTHVSVSGAPDAARQLMGTTQGRKAIRAELDEYSVAQKLAFIRGRIYPNPEDTLDAEVLLNSAVIENGE